MARSYSIPAQEYTVPRPPLVFELDNFPGNFDVMELVMTRENWPAGSVAIVTSVWGNGDFNRAKISGAGALDKQGNPATEFRRLFDVPRTQLGAVGVTSGFIIIEFLQSILTKIDVSVRKKPGP